MRSILPFVIACIMISSGTARAFHEAGAANCDGCHRMRATPGVQSKNAHMLKEAAPSDVCLNCHATELGAVLAADVLSPAPEKGAGNFIFLLEDNLNDLVGTEDGREWIPGDAAGHNIIAPNFGIAADQTLRHAPGGDFRSAWLGCTSCHDPHDAANFRMLNGNGPVQEGLFDFTNAAPVATGISLYIGSESNDHHTAYQSGMSAWCANCHGAFHSTEYPRVLTHLSGRAVGAAVATIYNRYNGTADPTGGAQGNAYLAAVPFEDDRPQNTISSTAGPTARSKIMCLTCHRAHASSAPDAGRWDFNVTRLADDGRHSGSYVSPNPYGPEQRTLCNKCHAKDAPDALLAREL